MRRRTRFVLPVLVLAVFIFSAGSAWSAATDPGVRGGAADAGGIIAGTTPAQKTLWGQTVTNFKTVFTVPTGLGPRFNANSCVLCHSQPATGGTSPAINPLFEFANAYNQIPYFITANGPVREARFPFSSFGVRDGGVHDLFTITGQPDATGCILTQPDFNTEAMFGNIIFRIPTPLFGGGLIQSINDDTILANKTANLPLKQKLGIGGVENRSGNDGTITRFGWKAQNKSLLMFAGEASNVEMGVTNQLFTQERDETPGCLFNPLPENIPDFAGTTPDDTLGGIEDFAFFILLLAPPTPATPTTSTTNGINLFNSIGCAVCHVPTMTTATTSITALSQQPVNLFSDLLLHHMGFGLADNIIQGNAGPDQFRTAPLWGVGQRIFFLHDGRTTDLVVAIRSHASFGSEANKVAEQFFALPTASQQDILNFLRSL
jgi:CxxC motif-containing protein (DUF1111 family)